MIFELLIIIGLILINGIFSMAEMSIVAARKTKLEHAAAHGDKKSAIALKLANNPGRFLSTVQIGITLIGTLTSVYSGAGIVNEISAFFSRFETLAPISDKIAITLVVVGISFFTIILGELIPKQLGIIRSASIARILAGPLDILSMIARPFVWLLTRPGDLLIRWLDIKPSKDSAVTEDEIKAIIKQGTEGGEIQEIEQDIVERVFYLGDRKAGSLMTHRKDLVWLDINGPEETNKEKIMAGVHSVYPVCNGDFDKVEGVVYVKDLFTCGLKQEPIDLGKYLKSPLYIIENSSAFETLEKFRETKTHYSLVVDEYGSVAGMITLNDILEALVGDIPESEETAYEIIRRDDGSWLVDAQIPFYDFIQEMEIQYLDKTKVKFNTLGGFALYILHRIPRTGEKFTWRNYEFEIIDMDANRIDKILVKKLD